MRESEFQRDLIRAIKMRFDGCFVIKNDANYMQGIPDLLVLYKEHWAMLECKKSCTASRRPNQEFYVSAFNDMSYAAFVYPENKEEVLNELERAFEA